MSNDIPYFLLSKLLLYENGRLFWRERPPEMFKSKRSCSIWNSRYANKEAFTYCRKGYKTGSIYNKGYLAHRVIFCLVNKRWPTSEIDHIDGNPSNNLIENLREVSSSDNSKNMKRMGHNKTGITGVYYESYTKSWCASIESLGNRHKKRFTCLGMAISWRKQKEKEFGFYANNRR